MVSAVFLYKAETTLDKTLKDPKLKKLMVWHDSKKYLRFSEDFVKGDFRMRYTLRGPHRQPLYPMLLAATKVMIGKDQFYLAHINIFFGFMTLWVLYYGFGAVFKNRASGLIAALSYGTLDWIISSLDGMATRLLTEPVYIFLVLCILISLVLYMNSRKAVYIYSMAIGSALAYLTRPNGLFLIISVSLVLLAYDFFFAAKGEDATNEKSAKRGKILTYFKALIVLVVLLTPSWLPKAYYFGNPIYHGHLKNFLWADDYETARRGNPAEFSMKKYLHTHSWTQIIDRWKNGLKNVLWKNTVPELGYIFYFSGLFGLALGLWMNGYRERWIFLIFLLQILPLAWTNLAAPAPRVPNTIITPFIIFYIGSLVSALRGFGEKYLRSNL